MIILFTWLLLIQCLLSSTTFVPSWLRTKPGTVLHQVLWKHRLKGSCYPEICQTAKLEWSFPRMSSVSQKCRTKPFSTETLNQAVSMFFARDACVAVTGDVRREEMLSTEAYDHSIWKWDMFCSTWEFSNPARERMVGWTLWQGSSVLPLNIKGC